MPNLSLVTPNIATWRDRDHAVLRSILDLVIGRRGPRDDAQPLDEALSDALEHAEALQLACDLAYATAGLATGQRMRAGARLCSRPEPWELGLERVADEVLVTLFRGGALPEVALHERRLDAAALRDGLVETLATLRRATNQPAELAALACAAEALREAPLSPWDDAGSTEPASVSVEPAGDIPLVIAAEIALRTPTPSRDSASAVLRADLVSLLFRGRLRVSIGERTRELPDVFVFLIAEQLTTMCIEGLEAWSRGRPLYRRLTVGGAVCAVRIGSDRTAALTIGARRGPRDARSQAWTFPAMDVPTLVQGVVAFGRALARSVVRRDRAQASNLRLVTFRARVRALSEQLRDATRDDSKINAAPERYRAFAAASGPAEPSSDSFAHARLRFSARWFASVPSIDLRSTFLCGDALVVGATREMCCIDRRTGEIVWRRPVPRAVAVVTPLGIARLEADGTLGLYDLATGEVAWTMRLAPRVGGAASGAVVSAPGLPRMLIVSEGSRHLASIDLHAGEVRWRHAVRRGGSVRLRRAGKLAIVACGEPALSALDVMTGEVVWRFCDRLRFGSPVAVDKDALFAVAGDGAALGRAAHLHHLDPWSGASRWSAEIPAGAAPVGAPLLTPETVVVVTHGRRGTAVVGFDRKSGELRFQKTACTAPASCMAIDDVVIVNSDGGELVGIDANDGAVRYRHVFSGADGDKPRRLEPVLRSGALFVPQHEVQVVRPRDGTLLGRVPTDLVADLLRVDERCDVYVVEESGHLAAFAAAPHLALVR